MFSSASHPQMGLVEKNQHNKQINSWLSRLYSIYSNIKFFMQTRDSSNWHLLTFNGYYFMLLWKKNFNCKGNYLFHSQISSSVWTITYTKNNLRAESLCLYTYTWRFNPSKCVCLPVSHWREEVWWVGVVAPGRVLPSKASFCSFKENCIYTTVTYKCPHL